MKSLDSFTVDQLNNFIKSDHAQCGDVAALARIALAAKRAEPVYQYHTGIINEEGDIDWYWMDCDKGFYSQYDNQHRRIVYTTPQLNSPEVHKLILSEVSDFCAGLCQPGEPELPEDIQQALMNRIELVFNNCG